MPSPEIPLWIISGPASWAQKFHSGIPRASATALATWLKPDTRALARRLRGRGGMVLSTGMTPASSSWPTIMSRLWR